MSIFAIITNKKKKMCHEPNFSNIFYDLTITKRKKRTIHISYKRKTTKRQKSIISIKMQTFSLFFIYIIFPTNILIQFNIIYLKMMIFLKKYTQFELLKNIYVFAYTRVMYILIKMNW